MASLYFGRMLGPESLARPLAIKRLHPTYARSPELVAMLLDEATLLARVDHPNVVRALDVVREGDELYVVLEYVRGESLAGLMGGNERRRIEPALAAAIMIDVLEGLHAAHEARDEAGASLGLVHRDVSPQNILVGTDGHARVIDFGIAKASQKSHATRPGDVKGKLEYMAPEQLEAQQVDRRTDLFAVGVVLWEMIVGRTLFRADTDGGTIMRLLAGDVARPSELADGIPSALDDLILKATRPEPSERFATAEVMQIALEGAVKAASSRAVAAWVLDQAKDLLAARDAVVSAFVSQRSPIDLGTGDRSLSVSTIEPRETTQAAQLVAETRADLAPPPTVHTRRLSPRTSQLSRTLLGLVGLVACLALLTWSLTRPSEKNHDGTAPKSAIELSAVVSPPTTREEPSQAVAPPPSPSSQQDFSGQPVVSNRPSSSGHLGSPTSAKASGSASSQHRSASCTRTLGGGTIVLRPECK